MISEFVKVDTEYLGKCVASFDQKKAGTIKHTYIDRYIKSYYPHPMRLDIVDKYYYKLRLVYPEWQTDTMQIIAETMRINKSIFIALNPISNLVKAKTIKLWRCYFDGSLEFNYNPQALDKASLEFYIFHDFSKKQYFKITLKDNQL